MTTELRVRCCVCTLEWMAKTWPVDKCPMCEARQVRVVGEPTMVPDSMIDLRDRFAMAALTGYIAMHASQDCREPGEEQCAARAYEFADAMLAERAKRYDGVAVAQSEERNDTERPPAFSAEEVNTFSPVVRVLGDHDELTAVEPPPYRGCP